MAITLTNAAAEHLGNMLSEQSGCVGLRLGLKSAGCSGFEYIVDFAKEVLDADTVFEHQGLKIVVDERSLAFLDGTELDFGQDGVNSGLIFNNPNVKSACGCGESVGFV